MDLPYSFVDSIAKMIPNELNMTIDKALSMNAELRKLYESDEQVHVLIDMSKRLEGLPRHTSMHAAGCDLPGGGRSFCTAFTGVGWFDHNAVYDDDAGRARTVKNGLSGASNPDSNRPRGQDD